MNPQTKNYKHILIVTGEVSGDLHASYLLKSIKKLLPDVMVTAVGSEKLRETGAHIFADLSKKSTIGFLEPLKHIPYLISIKNKLLKFIIRREVDLIILVDYQGFNMIIAKKAKKHNIPLAYYIPPQDWIWGSRKGMKKITSTVDKIVAIFQQEYEIYKGFTDNVRYFGHPLVEIIDKFKQSRTTVQLEKRYIALFPGSRKQEIHYVLPEILSIVSRIKDQGSFIINLANNHFENFVRKQLKKFQLKIPVVIGKGYEILAQSKYLIATSGTISLEATIMEIPHTILYKFHPLSYPLIKIILKKKFKLNYFSIPNILTDKEIIPEYLQNIPAKKIATNITNTLHNKDKINSIKTDLKNIKTYLQVPNQTNIIDSIAEYVVHDLIHDKKSENIQSLPHILNQETKGIHPLHLENIIVQKYGGTSVGSTEKIKLIAKRIIKKKKQQKNIVVIVSAMGKSTDQLVSLAKEIMPTPSGREYDALLSTGESISAALLAMAINMEGYNSISLTGRQAGVYTEDHHNKARILDVQPQRILKELQKDNIVIITGFQGINSQGDTTTIGRGGSDTSAVVIAAALKAECCEIYTDVDGIYTTNPNLVQKAKKLDIVSYDEMLEMASLGAGVLHPRAVEGAKEYKLELHVRSSYNFEKGTLVKEVSKMEIKNPVTGIAYDSNVAKIAIQGIPDRPGIAGELFTLLSDKKINVDTIVQSNQDHGTNGIAFTVSSDDLKQAITITENFAKETHAHTTIHDKDVAKVSIIGVGMVSIPGVASKMFAMLGQNNINIDLITTSEIKVSCIIKESQTEQAVRILHKAFKLED